MTCVTPPYEELQRGDFGAATAALNVSLEITLNGNPHEATGSGRQFTYYREERHMLPKLHGVQPFGGPSGGGTWLTIHGSLLQPLAGMGNTPLCAIAWWGYWGAGADAQVLPCFKYRQ